MCMTPEDGHTTLRANQLLQKYFPEAFPAEKQPRQPLTTKQVERRSEGMVGDSQVESFPR